MQETIDAHDGEEENIEESRHNMKPLVKFNTVQLADKEDTMDPATRNSGDSPAVNNVVEPPKKIDLIASDSGGDDVKKHVGCQSESGSGTGSFISEPSIKGQEMERIDCLDHKCDISTSQVSEVAQESERGFSGFDLNEELSFEEIPGSVSSETHNISKQPPVCLDIDLNVADDNEDKDVIISGLPSGEESSVNACTWKPIMLHLDLNSCESQSQSCSSSSSSKESSEKKFDLNSSLNNVASLDHQTAVISLFGTQVEVNHRDIGEGGRFLEPASKVDWGHDSFAPGPSMYYYTSPYRPLGAPAPYMVDPRGVPIAPHFAPPFVTNMASGGPYFDSTRAGPMLQNMGLNLGVMLDGGNSGGSSSSVVGGKRHEPDGGWEALAVNYKHQQPPWK